MIMDLHVHSSFSSDAEGKVREIVKLAKKLGLSGIAITDHNEIKGSLEAFQLSKEINGLLVLRGMEVSSSEGHILAYGIHEKVERDLSPQDTIEKIEELGGIAVIAHPYRVWSGVGEGIAFEAGFSAVEVHNSRSLRHSNERAKALASKLGLGRTGGSDCHVLEELGRGITRFRGNPENEESILEEISRGRTEGEGSSRGLISSASYAAKCVSEWIGRGMRRI